MPVTPVLLKTQISSDSDYTAQKQEERERADGQTTENQNDK